MSPAGRSPPLQGNQLDIRTAFGALPRRLARQLFTESLIFSSLGTLLALGLAHLLLKRLPWLSTGPISKIDEVALNPQVLLFAGCLGLLVAFFSGLLPVRKTLRNSLHLPRTRSNGGETAPRSRRLLVISEVALAVLLLISCGEASLRSRPQTPGSFWESPD